jgi:hypothetical protein
LTSVISGRSCSTPPSPRPAKETEQKMDELAREFAKTRDTGIAVEIFRLGGELEKMKLEL